MIDMKHVNPMKNTFAYQQAQLAIAVRRLFIQLLKVFRFNPLIYETEIDRFEYEWEIWATEGWMQIEQQKT